MQLRNKTFEEENRLILPALKGLCPLAASGDSPEVFKDQR